MAGRKVKRRHFQASDLNWADALQKHILERHEEPIPEGEGWRTAEEISKQIGHNKEYVSRWLSRMVADGKAERKLFCRVVNATPAYRRKLPMFRLLSCILFAICLTSCSRPREIDNDLPAYGDMGAAADAGKAN